MEASCLGDRWEYVGHELVPDRQIQHAIMRGPHGLSVFGFSPLRNNIGRLDLTHASAQQLQWWRDAI